MSNLETWNKTDASNNGAPPAGAPENMDPGNVNDVLRAIMGGVRRWYDDPEYLDLMRNPTTGAAFTLTRDSDTVLRVVSGTTDMTTPYAPVGRRVKVIGDTTVFGRITASSFPNPDTLVTIDGDGAAVLPNNPTSLLIHILATTDSDVITGGINPIEIGEFL